MHLVVDANAERSLQHVAQVLGMDDTLLRVITPDVGGGFGPKYCIYPEEAAAAAAARLLAVS